jgi:hypothetical protein
MQDVLNATVGAYVIDTVTAWLYANSGVASGALLLAVTAALWRRSRS